MTNVTIVKLGGSHAYSQHLREWIAALEQAAGQVVVVPGGGPFADAVRQAQARMGFGDASAHAMALLAMEQYGLALVGLGQKLEMVRRQTEIQDALRRRCVPVWAPAPIALADASIARSWNVTSDSLALLLAGRLRAERLVLVKQRPAASSDPAKLAEEGLVDRAFPSLYRERSGGNWISGPNGFTELPRLLRGEATSMMRLSHG